MGNSPSIPAGKEPLVFAPILITVYLIVLVLMVSEFTRAFEGVHRGAGAA
jgi:hypothetical protein